MRFYCGASVSWELAIIYHHEKKTVLHGSGRVQILLKFMSFYSARVCFREKGGFPAIFLSIALSPFPLQVDRPRLLDDVRAHDQLQVRAEDGEEATHGGGPRQAGEGELGKILSYILQVSPI